MGMNSTTAVPSMNTEMEEWTIVVALPNMRNTKNATNSMEAWHGKKWKYPRQENDFKRTETFRKNRRKRRTNVQVQANDIPELNEAPQPT